MKLFTFLSNKLSAFTALITTIALTSCGSYQYVGQTNDGIYETSNTYGQQTVVIEDESNNNDYYTNYFKEKALEAEAYDNSTDDVFTDIDSYEGTYTDSTQVVQKSGWGDTNDKVVINVYNDVYASQVARFGWNNWGWNSWGMTPWGWNNWRWNRPWGWNSWGWNAGFYDPFWYGGYYGYGYNPYFYGYGYSPYYNGYAYNGIYTRRGISYNAGRRGTLLRSSSFLSGRSNATRTTRSNSIVRPRTTTRSNSTTRPRTRANTTRPSTNTTTRPRTRSNTTRPRTNTSRPTRSYSTPRSSSSSTRSFGGSRSSGSSRSSSGRRGG